MPDPDRDPSPGSSPGASPDTGPDTGPGTGPDTGPGTGPGTGLRTVLETDLPTPEATRALGTALGHLLRAGDLLVLTGDLGAGKTTLTQGLGEALGVRGAVTSPTFVIARVHPALGDGPPLVHVDAYRLGGTLELDDLDLDAGVEESVTVVEWGHGVAELLSPDRLELTLTVGDGETRHAVLGAAGPRWAGPQAAGAFAALAG